MCRRDSAPVGTGTLTRMAAGTKVAGAPRRLRPVQRRSTWIAWGLALQAIGVGIPVTAALRRAGSDGLLGSITHYTVRLVWHELLRSRADVALILLGVLVFVAGAIVLARPFVTRRSTLFCRGPRGRDRRHRRSRCDRPDLRSRHRPRPVSRQCWRSPERHLVAWRRQGQAPPVGTLI